MEKYKYTVCAAASIMGNYLGEIFGGWDIMLKSLIILMIFDYISGFFAALIGKSPKTVNGKANSRVGFSGLVKKGIILILVAACVTIDELIGTNCFVRNSCIVGFCVNEILSLSENAALFGINIPYAMNKGVDMLKKKESEEDE